MKPEPIDDEQLCAMLRAEESGSVGFRDGELAESQRVALDFYNGELFGDEEDGRSQFVTRDVAEVVDYMTVSVLRAFVSGDHVVEFEGDVKAKEITAAIHHIFTRKQSGYRILHDWIKSGLIERIGVVKTTCETETVVERHKGAGVSGEMLAMFHADDDIVITRAEVDGQDQNGNETFAVAGERSRKVVKFRDYGIPVEEFLFAPRTVSEDTATYVAHRSRKTRSELIEMGFDADVVYDLPMNYGPDFDSRRVNRFEDEGGLYNRGMNIDPASQVVMLLEEYLNADRDGDGRAELLCVHRVGNTILEVTEVDERPFVVFTPFPMPYRMVGQSLADKVMDIQRLRSVLWRQTLDNLYLTNAPRTFIHEDGIGDNTIDDLLTVRPNSLVRWRGAVPPTSSVTPFAAGASVQMIEMASGERESRTGITRMNQGLDKDALNKTASGTAMMMHQGAQIEEYIARNFGEALARLFAKKLRLMAGRGEPFVINIEGKPVDVDPREWKADLDMNVQVGLGTGRKDQRIQARLQIVNLQAQASAGGLPLVGPKQFFNSAAGIVADLNLGATSDYFLDPETPEGQQLAQQLAQAGQNKPDPALLKIAAQQQADQANFGLKQQQLQMEASARESDSAARAEAAANDAQLRAYVAREKTQTEAGIAQQQLATEAALAQHRTQVDADIALQTAAMGHAAKIHAAGIAADARIKQFHPGGRLDK